MASSLSDVLYDNLVAAFKQLDATLFADWWGPCRQRAWQFFSGNKLPTNRSESYRYTPITTRLALPFVKGLHPLPLSTKPVHGLLAQALPGYHLVIKNDVLQPLPRLPKGVIAQPFSALQGRDKALLQKGLCRYASMEKDAFVALNTACFRNGLFIRVQKGTVLKEPFYLHFYTSVVQPTALYPRCFFYFEEESKAAIVEIPYALGGAPLFTNKVSEVYLAPGAQLHRYLLRMAAAPQGYLLSHTEVFQQEASTFHQHAITLEGALVRDYLRVQLVGKGSTATLYGGYMGKGDQYIENEQIMLHGCTATGGHTRYKGLVSDKSTAVFNGKIKVLPGAQLTDASQSHAGWILSRDARIYTRPQLAIAANEVMCSHGSTTAQPDPTALFYLRTRGISLACAQRMLQRAFLHDIIATIPIDVLQHYVAGVLEQRMDGMPH